MGIFSKKYKLPEDALNISLFKESLFLETNDGYITKETYTVDNMRKVTAFLYGSYNLNKHEYKKRVPIEEISPLREACDQSRQDGWRISLEEKGCNHFVHIRFYDEEGEKDFGVVADRWLNDDPNENESCILALMDYIRAKNGLKND